MKNKTLPIVLSFLLVTSSISPILLLSASAQNNLTRNQKIAEGNKYAKIGHDAYKINNYLKAAENYEKAYKLTKTKVYADNAEVAYISYAFKLTNDKNYDQALFYTNKVLSTNPKNNHAKELLSDIYFSRGIDYFDAGDSQKAKIDFNESEKYFVTQDQKERAEEALEKLQNSTASNSHTAPSYHVPINDSIPEIVSKMENKVNGKILKDKPLLERVALLEKESLGKTYEADGLVVRTDRLEKALIPEYVSQLQQNAVKDNPYANTYIPSIMDQSMGKVTIFGKMPISVFIDEANVKPYKNYYNDAVVAAMKEWEKASDNKIKFQVINEAAKSDIKVVWTEDFEDFPWQPTLQKDDISAEKEKMKYRKANAIVQIGSVAAMLAGGLLGVPIIGGIGSVGGGFASPYLQYKGMNTNRLSPDVKINVKVTEGMTEEQAKAKIKQVAMHQIGHAIGIAGHSPNPNDIMYPNFTAIQLSEQDINTIKEIYKSKPPTK